MRRTHTGAVSILILVGFGGESASGFEMRFDKRAIKLRTYFDGLPNAVRAGSASRTQLEARVLVAAIKIKR